MPKVNTKRALEVKSRDIDSAVVEWYRKARSRNIPVTEPVLQEKACQIADRMALIKNEFRASSGWQENGCQIADRMALMKNEFRASNGWLEKFILKRFVSTAKAC